MRMRTRLLTLTVAALALALPASALGETGGTPEDAAATAAAATKRSESPKRSGSAAKLPSFRLTAAGTYRARGRGYVLPRTPIDLRAAVNADLGGQRVNFEVYRGKRLIRRRSVKLQSADGKAVFHLRWRPGNKGNYRLKIGLSAEQRTLARSGNGTKIGVVSTRIRRGSRGISVRVHQSKLRRLRYVVPLNGRFDAATARAFMAFRKVTGMRRSFSAGYSVSRKLAQGKGAYRLRHAGAGRHVEVSIGKQIMVFASGGKVTRIYHVSTGAPATPTIRGTYRVYRKDWGTNEKGMVHSAYFIRGYAIHGYKDVPPWNASHGCVRVPIPNAASIFRWINYGTRVDTYY